MKQIRKSSIRVKNGNEMISSPSIGDFINQTGFDKTSKIELIPIKQKEGSKLSHGAAKTSRTIYYPQNFRKLKKGSKIKVVKGKQ